MYPKAREDGLRVREVGRQFAIFDEEAGELHILNETVAIVWRHCDGFHSTSDLTRILASETSSASDEEALLAALDELAEANLLESVPEAAGDTISRRQLLKGATGVAAVTSLAVFAGSARGASKVQVCHRGRTIWISQDALGAHLAHGDTLGPCGATTTSTTTESPPPTTTSSTTTPFPTTTTSTTESPPPTTTSSTTTPLPTTTSPPTTSPP
jgi:Coenzyme PQQ synthesis protein D (PqqD)/TAT (twin-arginine translocation) pathway signal sequence